ncbi:hypothetical protein SCG7109_AB_00620 [Chlamydiales bacterium SCGC AG-110-M15]|nr:hypothetical protein SCG7109_AB_00620 [Chlamydiales bacterium SCGC AG-110-M15]
MNPVQDAPRAQSLELPEQPAMSKSSSAPGALNLLARVQEDHGEEERKVSHEDRLLQQKEIESLRKGVEQVNQEKKPRRKPKHIVMALLDSVSKEHEEAESHEVMNWVKEWTIEPRQYGVLLAQLAVVHRALDQAQQEITKSESPLNSIIFTEIYDSEALARDAVYWEEEKPRIGASARAIASRINSLLKSGDLLTLAAHIYTFNGERLHGIPKIGKKIAGKLREAGNEDALANGMHRYREIQDFKKIRLAWYKAMKALPEEMCGEGEEGKQRFFKVVSEESSSIFKLYAKMLDEVVAM